MNYEQKLHIRLEAYVDGEEAVFTVSDDGPGMAPEMVENINNGVFPHEKGRADSCGYRQFLPANPFIFTGTEENFRWNPCRRGHLFSRL